MRGGAYGNECDFIRILMGHLQDEFTRMARIVLPPCLSILALNFSSAQTILSVDGMGMNGFPLQGLIRTPGNMRFLLRFDEREDFPDILKNQIERNIAIDTGYGLDLQFRRMKGKD